MIKTTKHRNLRVIHGVPDSELPPANDADGGAPLLKGLRSAAELRRHLAADPHHEPALAELARLLSCDRLWNEAADVYRTLAARFPSSAVYHLELGRCLYQLRECDPAVASLSEAVRLDPHGPSGRHAVAIRLMAASRLPTSGMSEFSP